MSSYFGTIQEKSLPMPQPAAEPRYAVYHARDPWAMLLPRADRWLDNQALHYRHVADVQADELDQVFALTNHQEEESWTSHHEIVWHASDAPVRSTVCNQDWQGM